LSKVLKARATIRNGIYRSPITTFQDG